MRSYGEIRRAGFSLTSFSSAASPSVRGAYRIMYPEAPSAALHRTRMLLCVNDFLPLLAYFHYFIIYVLVYLFLLFIFLFLFLTDYFIIISSSDSKLQDYYIINLIFFTQCLFLLFTELLLILYRRIRCFNGFTASYG